MVVLWAGYPFSKDYNKPRGHFYALTDVGNPCVMAPKTTPKTVRCHGLLELQRPDVSPRHRREGEDGYFKGMWAKAARIVNTIGCADCHDTASKSSGRANRPAPLPPLCRPGP